MHNILAHAGGLVIRQSRRGAGRIQTQPGGGSIGNQRIADGMQADRGNGHREFPVFPVGQNKPGTGLFRLDFHRPHIGRLAVNAEPDRMQPVRQLGGGQQVIVGIEHQRRAVRQSVADLQLCFHNILAAAQVFQMAHTDLGDDTCRGPRGTDQAIDFPQCTHAHLHHRVLGGVVQAEQGVGQADLVVLVALGLEGVAECGKHRIAEFLGGGLAHTAGDADHQRGKQHPVIGGHPDHGMVAGGNQHQLVLRHAVHRVIGHNVGSAGLAGGCRVVMAVHMFAREADENAARGDLAAVGDHRCDGLGAHQGQTSQQLICGNRFHLASLLLE